MLPFKVRKLLSKSKLKKKSFLIEEDEAYKNQEDEIIRKSLALGLNPDKTKPEDKFKISAQELFKLSIPELFSTTQPTKTLEYKTEITTPTQSLINEGKHRALILLLSINLDTQGARNLIELNPFLKIIFKKMVNLCL